MVTQVHPLKLRGSLSAIVVVSKQDKVVEYRNGEKQLKLCAAVLMDGSDNPWSP